MASYDLPGVSRSRFNVETTFGVDGTGTMANFFDLRHMDAELTRDDVMVPDETVVQRQFQQRLDVAGPPKCSYPLSAYLTGTNEAITDGVTATPTAQSKVMEAILGGYSAPEGSLVEAAPSPTTTGCTVTAGDGVRFLEGQIIGLTVSGVVYPRVVASRATDAITWWPALPSAPAGGSVVHNSQTVFPQDRPSASLAVLVEHAVARGNIWLGMGMQGDLTIDLTRGQLAKWGSSLVGVKYLHDDELATPQGGSAIAAAAYDGTLPVVISGAALHFGPEASSALANVAGDLTLNLAREWTEVPQHDGIEGVAQWHVARSRITAELTLPFADETYHDAWRAQTKYRALYHFGTAAANIVAAALTNVQITRVEPADFNGLRGQKLSLLCLENEDGDLTTEQGRAPFLVGGV